MKHEVFEDPERDAVFEKVGKWLLQRVAIDSQKYQ